MKGTTHDREGATVSDQRCRTCKWWGSSDEGCWRHCRRSLWHGGKAREGTLAHGYSFEDPAITAVTVTLAEYGCVQWERGDND